jgi:transposase InsO family protein
MSQIYHQNAVTNVHIRRDIHNSLQTNVELAKKHGISINTSRKWKNRNTFEDKSSRPNTIHYAVGSELSAIIVSLRTMTWMAKSELHYTMRQLDPNISESAVYRTLVRNKINTVPKEKREQAKKFKEYEPGYLHIDVTYLPVFEGTKYYLFVAIDRATRIVFYKIYDAKTSENAADFLINCKEFYPFCINKILTDNGLEFTNRLIKSKKGQLCKKDALFDIECKKNENQPIEHRLTKPNTPKTNGMVERVNGTIKSATILNSKYLNKKDMEMDLLKFLIYYNMCRKHGSLRKELNVKTPYEALEKWYNLKPNIFYKNPCSIKYYLISLQSKINQEMSQRGET